MAANGTPTHKQAIIGNEHNFWRYSSQSGFDLSHPPTPKSSIATPSVTMMTTTSPITIDPTKSALVIIDMQHFFLSPAFGRARGAGHAALDQLVRHAIPAARKSGIRIVWLNWGLSEGDVKEMPPAVTRAFGFEMFEDEGFMQNGVLAAKGKGVPVDKQGNPTHQGGHVVLEDGTAGRKYKGLGTECGIVEDPKSGKEIDAGRLLMRGAWNSGLYPPLDKLYEEGAKLETRPDVWVHKNRMSGMWGASSACEEFLQREGIRTLLFAGVNTDQVSLVIPIPLEH